jgi:hypothetical protein
LASWSVGASAEAAREGARKARDPGTEGSELAAALRRIGALGMDNADNARLRAKIGQSGPLARKRRR